MSFSIPMAALLTLAATSQVPDSGGKPTAVTPFVGDEAALVVRIDFSKWEAQASSRRLLGKLADDSDIAEMAKSVDDWVEALKKAGAAEMFLIFDPTDMPGYPVAVVPLAGSAKGRSIAELLSGSGPNLLVRWPATETIRDAVVAGTRGSLDRVRDAKPRPRPELATALGAIGPATIQIAMAPSMIQRRTLEESMPSLLSQMGGGPITTLTRGMNWVSIALAIEPKPTLRIVLQSKDAEVAKGLQKLSLDALSLLASATRSNPSTPTSRRRPPWSLCPSCDSARQPDAINA